MTINRQWLLAERPTGMVGPHNFKYAETPIPKPKSGEVIGSGTVGLGCGLEHLQFLNDGDIVELEIEKIGTITNKVIKTQNK